MTYQLIKNVGFIGGFENILTRYKDGNLHQYQIRSREDFAVVNDIDLGERKYAVRYFEDKVVLTDLKQNHIEILVNQCEFNYCYGDCFNIQKEGEFESLYCPGTKEYVVKFSNRIIYRFPKPERIELKFYGSYILEIDMVEKTCNSIKCIDAKEGKKKWQLDYEGKIIRCEQLQNLLIVDYHAYEKRREDEGFEGEVDWSNPNVYTIVVHMILGQEVWRRKMSFSKIDKQRSVVLGGNGAENLLEVDICSGEIISELKVKPSEYYGYVPHFADEEGIYYTNHYGAFGKVRRKDGIIDWEYHLADSTGNKRKLSDWILLGNRKLVLQSLIPSNGDITCIFDPSENLSFSLVKDGKRVEV